MSDNYTKEEVDRQIQQAVDDAVARERHRVAQLRPVPQLPPAPQMPQDGFNPFIPQHPYFNPQMPYNPIQQARNAPTAT